MQRSRDPLLLATAILTVGIALVVLMPSLAWIGQPFSGFLLLENRVVASAGLTHWPATSDGTLYQQELVSVDGAPVKSSLALAQQVRELPVGTPLLYGFQRGEDTFERVVHTRRFEVLDWALLFGSLLLNGIMFAGTALMILFLRGRDRLSIGAFAMLSIGGLWALTAVDLYGPHRLFRLHALCETLLFAGVLHMALVFPRSVALVERRPWLIPALYAAAGVLATANQLGLYDPDWYRWTHQAATSAFGVSLGVLIGMQLRWYLQPPSFEIRQRVKAVALGAILSLTLPVVLALGAALTGGSIPQNVAAFTAVFYPLSIGYAVIRHNLLGVDVFVRRTLSYTALTAVATVLYAALVQAFDVVFHAGPGVGSDPYGFALTLILVMMLLPLRDQSQSFIDRIFFRASYDFRRVVETASERLASESDLNVISRELIDAVRQPLQPERMRLYVRRSSDEPLGTVHTGPENSALDDALADTGRRTGLPIDQADGGLLVPFRADGKLMAVLDLARPQSGRMYGADDRRLLMILANQGAVAIENALALEGLRDLNRDLEEKVEERTAELREAHSQLVHREKMASLGQLVAGIAHEINNPLNFIQGNLHCLRESVGTLQGTLEAILRQVDQEDSKLARKLQKIRLANELDEVLDDVGSAFDGCQEGVERSTALVNDLRSFSRADSRTTTETDLHAAIGSSLNLLRSKLHGIEIVRDLEPIPTVHCIARQIDQVLVNLIANAADALEGRGRIAIRTRLQEDDVVVIEVEDDGPGIDPSHLDRIFDPFFTTKEVGKGTGLGLSISYGIVSRHGGALTVQSEPGQSTCFRVVMPVGVVENEVGDA